MKQLTLNTSYLGDFVTPEEFALHFKLAQQKEISDNQLANDLTFRLDISLRDVFNSNSRLDQTNAYGTGGQRELTLQPSVDYVLNSKINLKFYFDQRKATPYISSSPPMTNTRAGVNIRIAL